MNFPKRYSDFVARLRVPAGFAIAAAFAWLSVPDAHSLAEGLPVSLAGLALRAWAAGHLAKNRELATGGPYAWLRNPLYVGTLLVALGLAIASRSAALTVVFGAVFLLVYLPVVELEEQHLRKLFPEYEPYAARVGRFWPTRPAKAAREKFRLALYMKNQEYQAAAGFLLGFLLLVWKAR